MSHQPSPYRQISAECRYLVKTFTLSVFHPASFLKRVPPSADHWPSSLWCLHSARYHSCLPSQIVGLCKALANKSAMSSLLSSSRLTLLASRPSRATALQGFVRLQLARSQGYLPSRLPPCCGKSPNTAGLCLIGVSSLHKSSERAPIARKEELHSRRQHRASGADQNKRI